MERCAGCEGWAGGVVIGGRDSIDNPKLDFAGIALAPASPTLVRRALEAIIPCRTVPSRARLPLTGRADRKTACHFTSNARTSEACRRGAIVEAHIAHFHTRAERTKMLGGSASVGTIRHDRAALGRPIAHGAMQAKSSFHTSIKTETDGFTHLSSGGAGSP
jgi:hypothetical protein